MNQIDIHAGAGRNRRLTKREAEVLEEMSIGLSNRQIAECLGITTRTVEAHVGRILSKLQVRSRTQAVLGVLRSHRVETDYDPRGRSKQPVFRGEETELVIRHPDGSHGSESQ